MKKSYLAMIVILIMVCFSFYGCGNNSENYSAEKSSINNEDVESIAETEDSEDVEAVEDVKDAEKATYNENSEKVDEADAVIMTRHSIDGATPKAEGKDAFEETLESMGNTYSCKEIYIEYQKDGSIYLEIACDGNNLDSMTDIIVDANKSTGYNNTIFLTYVDQDRYKDDSASGIVYENVDILPNGEIYTY